MRFGAKAEDANKHLFPPCRRQARHRLNNPTPKSPITAATPVRRGPPSSKISLRRESRPCRCPRKAKPTNFNSKITLHNTQRVTKPIPKHVHEISGLDRG